MADLKTDIYFNTQVSEHLQVPFNNKGYQMRTTGAKLLNIPKDIVTWDIDTKKTLEYLKSEDIDLVGLGDGRWEIFIVDTWEDDE